MKSLWSERVKGYIQTDPERYIEIVDKDTEYAFKKSKTSWFNKKKWSVRVSICQWQKTTALMNCGRIEEAKEILEYLRDGFDIQKAQQNGNRFYIIILANLISALMDLERYDEAREKLNSFERTLSNIDRQSKSAQGFFELFERIKSELDIRDGDIEKGGRYLKDQLALENDLSKIKNIFFYLGIYYYKRNEKDKALEYFEKTSSTICDQYTLKEIKYYKTMLMYKEPNYKEDEEQVNEVQNQVKILKELHSKSDLEFNKFASAEEIEEAEAITGIKFNKQLEALFMLFNGGNQFVQGKIIKKDSVYNFRFLNLEDALSEWAEFKPYSFYQYNGWPLISIDGLRIKPFVHHKYWFPIAKGDNIHIYFDADAKSESLCGQIIGVTDYPLSSFLVSENLADFLKLSEF